MILDTANSGSSIPCNLKHNPVMVSYIETGFSIYISIKGLHLQAARNPYALITREGYIHRACITLTHQMLCQPLYLLDLISAQTLKYWTKETVWKKNERSLESSF